MVRMEAVHIVYSQGENTITVAAIFNNRATSPQNTIIYYSTHKLQKKFPRGAGTVLPLLPVKTEGVYMTTSHKGEPACLDPSSSYGAQNASLMPKLCMPSW